MRGAVVKSALISVILGAFVLLNSMNFASAGQTCTCRYFGQDMKVGTKICMKSWKGHRVATCGFELNNTAWKISNQKCEQVASSMMARTSFDLAFSNYWLGRDVGFEPMFR
jgi:hypothetical protein